MQPNPVTRLEPRRLWVPVNVPSLEALIAILRAHGVPHEVGTIVVEISLDGKREAAARALWEWLRGRARMQQLCGDSADPPALARRSPTW
jgi:hypothetical protein